MTTDPCPPPDEFHERETEPPPADSDCPACNGSGTLVIVPPSWYDPGEAVTCYCVGER